MVSCYDKKTRYISPRNHYRIHDFYRNHGLRRLSLKCVFSFILGINGKLNSSKCLIELQVRHGKEKSKNADVFYADFVNAKSLKHRIGEIMCTACQGKGFFITTYMSDNETVINTKQIECELCEGTGQKLDGNITHEL
jgi:hypothetical protein